MMPIEFLFKRLRCSCWVLTLVFVTAASGQIKTEVKLVRGGDPRQRGSLSEVLTKVMQEINLLAEDRGELKRIENYFTDEGLDAVKKIIESGFYTTAPGFKLTLIGTASGKYEIRGITGRVAMGRTEGEPIQELVLVLNWQGMITDVRFAIESHHYQAILADGEKLQDYAYREEVLNFIEQFRTAHNTKNLEFLQMTYSDNALIIVGRKVEEKKGDRATWSGNIQHSRIEFVRRSKEEYITRLSRVFANNDFVKVTFDSVSVMRHPKHDRIYGITLKQRWNSSTYSDEGFLFIMMDFRATPPMIRVRSWQPETFEDGTIVGLHNFQIAGGQ